MKTANVGNGRELTSQWRNNYEAFGDVSLEIHGLLTQIKIYVLL